MDCGELINELTKAYHLLGQLVMSSRKPLDGARAYYCEYCKRYARLDSNYSISIPHSDTCPVGETERWLNIWELDDDDRIVVDES